MAEAPVEDAGQLRVRFPVLVIEGADTGDGRFIVPGGLSARPLPISLLAQPYESHGGQDPPAAEVFGRITTLTRHPGPQVRSPSTGEPYGADVWVWSAEGVIDAGHEWADLVRKKYLRGASVRVGATDVEVLGDDEPGPAGHPDRRVVLRSADIAAVTMVPVPAFGDCYGELVDEQDGAPVAASALPAGM
ncbi:MAG: hypothetical protein ACRDSN_06770, partial [Pseudonocardiaceae bacterium]